MSDTGFRPRSIILSRRSYPCRNSRVGEADTPGSILGIYCRPCFYNIEERDLETSTAPRYSKKINVSRMRTYTIMVVNTGKGSALVQTEISPDGLVWDSFGELPSIIAPGASQLFLPQSFLRYVRIKYMTWRSSYNTKLTLWVQGQG